jgi:hypothetical protein
MNRKRESLIDFNCRKDDERDIKIESLKKTLISIN